MSDHMRLLEGVVEPQEDPALDALREEVRRLRGEVQQARAETVIAKREATHALGALRKQLSPLYRALQAVFGELDAANIDEDRGTVTTPKVSAVWESWKQKLPGKPAEFITILMEHGDMNAAQLRIAARCSSDTVYQTIHKLNKAGLVNKNGGRFSLKTL